jgi:acetyltransferase
MSTYHLQRVINPESIAVIGASPKKGRVGEAVMENLLTGGFKGNIFPVNPKYDTVMGLKAFKNVKNLPRHIDLSVIATPMSTIPRILEVCAEKEMGGAVIISAMDGMSIDYGIKTARKIKDISRKTGLRIIGPDSVGIVNTNLSLNASFMHRMPLKGKIAFLSQSGAVCTAVLDMALRENIGFSHFVSLGSMPDVCFADMIDFLGSSNEVESIVMYVEHLSGIRNFMSAARAVSRIKPMIVLKSGRSGSEGPISEDDLYDAAFKRAGILRVNDFEALFDCVEFLAKQERPKGSRLAIVSNAAGIGVMAKDALVGYRLMPATLSQETVNTLEALLKGNWSRTNPIDLLRESFRNHYVDAAKICMNAPEVDGLLLLNSPVGTFDSLPVARQLAEILKTSSCPVFTSWMGGLDRDDSRAVFNKAGIATYETPERAVRAFVNLYQFGRNMALLQEIPYRTDKRLEINRSKAREIIDQAILSGGGRLSDHLAKDLVSSYGIPVASNRMQSPADYELTISAIRHEDFGPVIRFGMGGIMTDVIKDVSMALPPLNRILARRVIEETQISKVFEGYGNIEKIDMESLEEILIRMSRLVTDFPEIREVDINPVKVIKGRMMAAHGRVIVEKTDLKSASHLIISPYPFWQEKTFRLKDGTELFFRPVRPSDAQQMIDLFDDLSPETIYLRFFSPIKRISRSMLIKLTQIDYDREIALLAFAGPEQERKLLGVARIIFLPDGKQAEFAIVLADAWQGKGIGKTLLHHALVCAVSYGIEEVWGSVISTNTGMIRLGESLGFNIKRDMDSAEYRLTIELSKLDRKG